MENKKNKKLIIIIVLLIICLLSLGGYIVYDKVLTKNNLNNEIKDENSNQQQEEVKMETSADELYTNYLENYKKNRSENRDEQNISTTANTSEDTYYTFKIKQNGDLIMSIRGENIPEKYENYKVDTNVLTMSLLYFGNGGYQGLWYLKEDGKVYMIAPELDIIENKEIVKKETEYKNIVEIKQVFYESEQTAGAWGIEFIDIEGNIHTN